MEHTQREALDKQFKEAREKLENEMQQAIKDHEAMLMRQGGYFAYLVWSQPIKILRSFK